LSGQGKANMKKRSQEDSVFQENQTEDSSISEDNLPKGFHGFMMGHVGHQDVTHSKNKGTKSFPVVPILLTIMVVLHILAAIVLSKTASGAFSFNNAMSYGMIGLLVVFVMSKLKHVLGFMRRKEKPSARGITNGVSSTSSVEHE